MIKIHSIQNRTNKQIFRILKDLIRNKLSEDLGAIVSTIFQNFIKLKKNGKKNKRNNKHSKGKNTTKNKCMICKNNLQIFLINFLKQQPKIQKQQIKK